MAAGPGPLPRGGPPTEGLLDLVGDDGQMYCACGCTAVIDDRSPSAYFASAPCSDRWHAARVENPLPPEWQGGDRRAARAARAPGVGLLGLGHVPATAWLEQLSPQVAESAVLQLMPSGYIRVEIPELPGVIRYTRRCPDCDTVTDPATVSGPFPADRPVTVADVVQSCPACDEPYAAAFFASVTVHDDPMAAFDDTPTALRLQLEDGQSRAAGHITPTDGFWNGDADAIDAAVRDARRLWTTLEHLLDDFTQLYLSRNWRRTGGHPAPAGRAPYAIDVPPPRRLQQLPPWRGRR